MKWLLKVTYGATTLTLTISQAPWTPSSTAVGGSDTSAAGVPEGFVIRRDRALDLRIRFYESEWPAVRAWLEYAQPGGAFTIQPEAAVATSYTCYLVSPALGEPIRPERGEHFGTFDMGLSVRTTNGAPIEPEYFT